MLQSSLYYRREEGNAQFSAKISSVFARHSVEETRAMEHFFVSERCCGEESQPKKKNTFSQWSVCNVKRHITGSFNSLKDVQTLADKDRHGWPIETATEATGIMADCTATIIRCSHPVAYRTIHDQLNLRKMCTQWKSKIWRANTTETTAQIILRYRFPGAGKAMG